MLCQTGLSKLFSTQNFNASNSTPNSIWKTSMYNQWEKWITFNTAYDKTLWAGLDDYVKKFIISQPGDWPCQFCCHQIIYQCVKKFLSYQQPHQVNNENPQAASDCSAYSYPSFPAWQRAKFAGSQLFCLLSPPFCVIPMIGPFHISECTMSSQNDDWIVLTGCFHSFHNTGLNG